MKRRNDSGRRERARLAALFELLEASTPAEVRRCLLKHPELLDKETDDLIVGLVERARDEGRNDIAEGLGRARVLLAWERARARGGSGDGELPARVLTVIEELGELTDTANLDRRIDLLRQVLADPAVTSPQLRAALSSFLGVSLSERCERSGSTDQSEAVAVLESALAGAAPTVRRQVHCDLGLIYARHGTGNPRDDTEAAIRHLTEALVSGDDRLPHSTTATVRAELANAYLKRAAGSRGDDVRKAVELLESANRFFTSRAHDEEWAGVRGTLGTAYLDYPDGNRIENIEIAIDYLTSAHLYFTAHGPVPAGAAAAHHLGNAYVARLTGSPAENVEKAIRLLEDALTIRTERDYPLDWAATSHSLGNAYLRRGCGERADNTEKSIDHFVAARDALARVGTAEQEAQARYSLAEAYVRRVLGDRDDAVDMAIANLEVAERLFAAEGMSEQRAAALTALGLAVSERTTGEPGAAANQAIGYHQAALAALGGGAPELRAVIENNLGTSYLERADSEKDDLSSAIAYFQRASASDATGRSALERAMTRHNLGQAYANRAADKDRAGLLEAAAHLEAALNVFADTGLPMYQRGAGQALGDVRSRLGDHWTGALAAYESALAAADALYVASVGSDARQAELAEAPALHLNAAYAAAMAGYPERAAVIIERGRARALGDALALDRAELSQVRKIAPDLVADFDSAATRLKDLEAAEWLASAITSFPGADPTAARPGDLRRELEEARRLLADAVAGIREISGHDSFLAQPEFADIAAAAHETGPLAYLAACARGSLTLLITAVDESRGEDQPTARAEVVAEPAAPLTAAELRTLVIGGSPPRGYLPALSELMISPRWFRECLAQLLPVLGERLTGPLADRLIAGGVDRVTMIACGLLGQLPLHAASYIRDRQAQCLLDDCTVAYAPSARALRAAHAVAVAAREREPVLTGVASPAGTGTLRYAEAEVRQIAAYFPHDRFQIFSGLQATRGNLLAAARGATHIHFACHGVFDPVEPNDSALLLSDDGQAAPLTLREIMAQRPFAGARLVAASACQTAATDFVSVPDETIGLPSSFLRAGIPGVAGTLWPVSDSSAALLMCRFYELHLDGPTDHPARLDPARALRDAQLWLARLTSDQLESYIDDHPELHAIRFRLPTRPTAPRKSPAGSVAQDGPFAHPFHWAPFVFVGT